MPERRNKRPVLPGLIGGRLITSGLITSGLITSGMAITSLLGGSSAFADSAPTDPTVPPTPSMSAPPAGPAAFPAADGLSEADGSVWTTTGQWDPMEGLATKVIGWTARPGGGVWEVNSNGGVFARGGAPFYGSLVGTGVNSSVVAIAATPTGAGYWLVTRAGGVFAFGDAVFAGGANAYRPASPVVAMAATPTGAGYWLATRAGGVFNFGDAAFFGSMAGRLGSPVVGIAGTATGQGYWLASQGGGVFNFGDADFDGSAAGQSTRQTVSVTGDAGGYDLVRIDGRVSQFRAGADPVTASIPMPKVEVAVSEAATAAPHPIPARGAASVHAKVVSAAYAQLGKPYVYGASGPGGFDCSGLTSYAYSQDGVSLPRTAAEQLARTRPVPASQLQPGDLVYFYPGITHVGIYIGNGQMIDAPHSGSVVRVDDLQYFGPLMGASDPAA